MDILKALHIIHKRQQPSRLPGPDQVPIGIELVNFGTYDGPVVGDDGKAIVDEYQLNEVTTIVLGATIVDVPPNAPTSIPRALCANYHCKTYCDRLLHEGYLSEQPSSRMGVQRYVLTSRGHELLNNLARTLDKHVFRAAFIDGTLIGDMSLFSRYRLNQEEFQLLYGNYARDHDINGYRFPDRSDKGDNPCSVKYVILLNKDVFSGESRDALKQMVGSDLESRNAVAGIYHVHEGHSTIHLWIGSRIGIRGFALSYDTKPDPDRGPGSGNWITTKYSKPYPLPPRPDSSSDSDNAGWKDTQRRIIAHYYPHGRLDLRGPSYAERELATIVTSDDSLPSRDWVIRFKGGQEVTMLHREGGSGG